MIDFKGAHYPKAVILHAAFVPVRYAISNRDLGVILQEPEIDVDRATLNRWAVKYSLQITANAQAQIRALASSWRMDETYIKIRGKWMCMWRAVDRSCQTHYIVLSERCDTAAARRFFKCAIAENVVIKRITSLKLGFKAFHSDAATLALIETAHRVHNGQFGAAGSTASQQLAALPAYSCPGLRRSQLHEKFATQPFRATLPSTSRIGAALVRIPGQT